jgi:hypothetical protein
MHSLTITSRNHTDSPISAGQMTLIPVSQSLIVQNRRMKGGLVWNRPVSVGLLVADEDVRYIPIYDYTRLAQVFILGAGVVGSLLIWLFYRKR